MKLCVTWLINVLFPITKELIVFSFNLNMDVNSSPTNPLTDEHVDTSPNHNSDVKTAKENGKCPFPQPIKVEQFDHEKSLWTVMVSYPKIALRKVPNDQSKAMLDQKMSEVKRSQCK